VLFLLLVGGLIVYLTLCSSESPIPNQLAGLDASDQTLKDGNPCPYWYKYKNTNQKMVDCDLYGGGTAKCMDVPTYEIQKNKDQLWNEEMECGEGK
jgi:hypothetical protein